MIHLFACTDDISDDLFLNDEQKEFIKNTKSDQLKKERTMALFALDCALRETSGACLKEMTIVRNDGKKPYFKNEKIFFNLSHTDSIGVCALSDSEVGVDVEVQTRTISEAITRRYPDIVSITDWTKREAYGKMTQEGFFAKKQVEHFFRTYLLGKYVITACSGKDEFTEKVNVRGEKNANF